MRLGRMYPVATGFREAYGGLTIAFSGTNVLSGVMRRHSVAYKQQYSLSIPQPLKRCQ